MRKATPDEVLEALHGSGGKVVQTSLSHDDEARLRSALDAEQSEETSMTRAQPYCSSWVPAVVGTARAQTHEADDRSPRTDMRDALHARRPDGNGRRARRGRPRPDSPSRTASTRSTPITTASSRCTRSARYLAGKPRSGTTPTPTATARSAARKRSTARRWRDRSRNADQNGDGVVRKEEYEAFSETTLYQNVDLPYVVPNIINKKF